MKKFVYIYLLFIVMCFSAIIYSQNTNTPVDDTANNTTEDDKNNEAANKDAVKEENKSDSSLPAGYGGATWGDDYEKVKSSVTGKIVFLDENHLIISRDGEIMLYYGFFYRDEEKVKMAEDAENTPAYFFTTIEFPYTKAEDIKKKYTEKYGEPVRDTLKDNRGAYIWESEDTVIIAWVDSYEDMPFVRRVNYLSKEYIEKLKIYNYEVFNQEKIEINNNLKP